MTTDLSDLLGYISIACWLGAQFPQVLENYRRQSCSGLAWPFLLNWLLGDASNLIGCLLTNQLPFQTWLATYFVIVDCSLVGQYLYYEGGRSTPPAYARGRRIASSRTRSPSRYRSRSSAAPHVAGTLVAHVGDVRHIPRATRRLSVEVGGPSDQLDDEAFNAASALTDSLNSESGHRPDHSRRVSWDVERPALPGGGHLSRSAMLSRSSIPSILHLTSTESIDGLPDTEGTDRGRTLRRDVEIVPESTTFRGDQPTVRSSRHGARTSAGVVFMGAWMIFGLGEVARRYDHGHVGFVLRDPMEVPVANEPASTERIIGRIFAWLCVSLYLTSRLPQIWKNFVRKSVDGLSMSLFLFAFLGNSFYVASILASPKMRGDPSGASTFLRESVPYLLGSGGTLMFDVTILAQARAYRRLTKRHLDSTIVRRRDEEERGLLTSQV